MNDGFKLGDYVYRSFRPRTPGKIIRIIGPATTKALNGKIHTSDYFQTVEVLWVSGVKSIIDTGALSDFNELIEDHKRKLNTHLTSLVKLKALEVK